MKVSREQVAENRKRILDAASKLFREKGFDAIGVDAVMKAAGLTHGGFYGHFASKDDLVAQACAHALAHADDSWTAATDPRAALASAYLDADHCANPGDGCALAALGQDIARQRGDARRVFTEALETRVADLASHLSGSRTARRDQSVATWAGLVGAMVLARGVDDPALSEEILKIGRSAFGGKPKRRAAASRSRR